MRFAPLTLSMGDELYKAVDDLRLQDDGLDMIELDMEAYCLYLIIRGIHAVRMEKKTKEIGKEEMEARNHGEA